MQKNTLQIRDTLLTGLDKENNVRLWVALNEPQILSYEINKKNVGGAWTLQLLLQPNACPKILKMSIENTNHTTHGLVKAARSQILYD